MLTKAEQFQRDMERLKALFVVPLEEVRAGGRLAIDTVVARSHMGQHKVPQSFSHDVTTSPAARGGRSEGRRVRALLDQEPALVVMLQSIRDAATLNANMLTRLRTAVHGWPETICVASIFEHFADVCGHTYSAFAQAHARSLTTLESPEFSDFLSSFTDILGESYESLLIKPVQWVLRLVLLLHSLQKETQKLNENNKKKRIMGGQNTDVHTGQNEMEQERKAERGEALNGSSDGVNHLEDEDALHPDTKALPLAIERLEGACEEINKYVALRESRRRIIALQKCMGSMPPDLNLLDRERLLLKHGQLHKQCRRRPKPYLFLLFDDLLIYAEGTARRYASSGLSFTESDRLEFHRAIELKDAEVGDVEPPPAKEAERIRLRQDGSSCFAFLLKSSQKSFRLYARSAKEKRDWLSAIGEAIELVRERGRPASPLVTQGADSLSSETSTSGRPREVPTERKAAVWQADSTDDKCGLCLRKFTFTRRRHHCRNCGALVCEKCSNHRVVLRHIDAKKKQRVCNPGINPKCVLPPAEIRQ
jgi:hypothetical protein